MLVIRRGTARSQKWRLETSVIVRQMFSGRECYGNVGSSVYGGPSIWTRIEGDSYRKRESEQETSARRAEESDAGRRAVTALCVSAVLTLYVDLPDTHLRASASDQWLARRFHDEHVPLRVVETALLLGSLRRLIRPAEAPRLSPIRSLGYFRPVIDEFRAHPAPESYLRYLRLKLRQVTAALPATVQKFTFSDDR